MAPAGSTNRAPANDKQGVNMEVKLPEMGEGIEEASVSFWYKKVGETAKEGEDLVELTTEKTSFNLPSPVSGTVKQISAGEGDKVKVGQTLAVIE